MKCSVNTAAVWQDGQVPISINPVGVNTPKKNGNWSQQVSFMKPSLVRVALWKKNYGVPELWPNSFYKVST